MSLNVLDIFCGCGGLSYGFELAGCKIVAGVDSWKDALNTFKRNHKNSQAYEHNLSESLPANIVRELGSIDVVIGGPPCQGFSISGNRDPSDPRNSLYRGFLKVVDQTKPLAFVLENVPNLLAMSNGSIKDQIVNDFEKKGYNVTYKVIMASDYGVPQNRKRVFFIGIKGKNFSFPSPIVGEQNRVTCEQAISDLPEHSLKDGELLLNPASSKYQLWARAKNSIIFNHTITRHEQKTVDTIEMVPDGGNYKDLPEDLRNTRKVNIAWTRYKSDKPSLTIDTGHRHHFHYKYNRVPTVRESARLQSFRDSFIFYGSKTSQYKQVGNAVPPLLGKAIAEHLMAHI